MQFTWDESKKAANPKRHPGVTFEMGIEAFDDPNQVVELDCLVEGQQRYHLIGLSGGLILVVVVYVDHSVPGNEVIRLISVRRAVKYEERLYEKQFE